MEAFRMLATKVCLTGSDAGEGGAWPGVEGSLPVSPELPPGLLTPA